MTWKDVSGVKNEILNLTGYFVVTKGTFSKTMLYWGAEYGTPMYADGGIEEVGASFDQDISYVSSDETDGTVRAHAIAYIVSPTDDKEHQFSIMVCPTIFD